MTEDVIQTITDPSFMIALLVAIAVFATVFTTLPAFGGDPLKVRMRSVALEREELRAKQRARLAAEATVALLRRTEIARRAAVSMLRWTREISAS